MAKTKIPGGYISDGAISSAHLHSSHGITTSNIGEGTNLYFTDARVIVSLGSVNAHILPSANETYDLGSTSLRWRDLFLSGDTINLGGTKLSKDSSGNLEIKDSSNNPKKIKVSEIEFNDGTNVRKLKISSGKLKSFDDSDAAVKLDLSSSTTSDISEGSNLYYTNARADARITNAGSANWNTAYGWGNHASAGYVTSSGNTIIGTDTDLSFTGANVLSTIALTDGVITAYTNRVLTLANLGYTGETNATADQTAAEIRAAVEAATDSNVFTDADHTKLGGIATNANNYVLPSGYATEAYVNSEITTLIGGAPSTLNDLNELAAAINDDSNYNSTLTTALATKLPLAGGTLTGTLAGTTASFSGVIYLGATATANDQFATNNGTDIFIGTSAKGLRTYKDLYTNSGNNKYWHAGDFANNSANWNTAYGWGNHASAGYYAASNPSGYTNDQTAAEILTAIKTVDGSGSGLDADLLDGQHGSYYQPADNTIFRHRGTLDLTSASGGHNSYPFDDAHTETRVAEYGTRLLSYTGASATMLTINTGGSASVFQIGAHYNGNDFYMRTRTDSSTWQTWKKLWHVGNDGAGSGLDADLLDGQQGSSFLRSDTADTATGVITFNSTPILAGTSANEGGELNFGAPTGGVYSAFAIDNYQGHFRVHTLTSGKEFRIHSASSGLTTIGSNIGTVWASGNDGSGSGLDADLLDGLQTASGPTANTIPTRTSNGDIAAREIILSSALITATPTVLVSMYPGTNQLVRTTPAAVALGMGAWTSSNDGSGSGLDADTVDGKHATDLLHYRGIVSGDWDTIFTTGTGKTNTSGLYQVQNLASGHSNHPTGVYTYGSVLAWQLVNSTFKLYSSHTGDLAFQSGWNNDEYSGWRRILNDSYYGAAWTSSNDGAGSGLDADLLDGQHGTHYTNAANLTGTLNKDRLPNFVHLGTATTTGYATDDGGWGSRLNVASSVHAKIEVSQEANSMRSHWFAHTGHDSIKFGTSTSHDVEFQRGGSTHLEIRSNVVNATNGLSVGAGNHTVWHAGNDGSGSGLDADLLDGLHASSFLRLDSGSATPQTVPANKIKRFSSQAAINTTTGSQGSLEVYGNNGAGTDAFMTFHVENDYALYFGLDGGTNKLSVGGWSAGAASHEIYHAGNKPSLATLGFTGATNANYITNNNQLTNGAAYVTSNTTRLGLDAHSLTTLNSATLWSQPSGYQTMVKASTSSGLPASHGQSYFGYNITSRRDTGTGYSALLTAYDNSNMWFTYNGTETNYPTWRKVWHDGNDGSGSGLDADLLDGQQPSISGGANKIAQYSTNGYLYVNNWIHPNNGTGLFYDAGVHFYEVSNNMYSSTGYTSANQGTLWGTSNDGSGSGLDADTVDGIQGANLLRSDVVDVLCTSKSSGTLLGRNGFSDAIGYNPSYGTYIGGGASNASHWLYAGGYLSKNGVHTLWHSGNDGSGSGLDADTVDGNQAAAFVRANADSTISNNIVVLNRGEFTCGTSGQNNTGQGAAYNWGYQQPGAWSHPYPDLVFGYHTGMRFGGHTSYGGCRFYADHPYSTTSLLFSVGNGDTHVRATNNIYAYTSDRRLKENFRPIENAVDKVKAIGGFIFDWRKDMMEKHDFTPDQQQDDAGLIAQEVQKVMPAAIKRAPFDHDLTKPNQSKSGEDFLTVQYEKMVPLLVEAIKEQQKQIDELKEKLENK